MLARKKGYLIILDNFENVREINLADMKHGKISFGREPDNDIVLKSKIVSKVHGYFEYIDENLYIYDNNSTNGIYINDLFYGQDNNGDVKIHLVQENDIIRIDGSSENRNNGDGVIMIYTEKHDEGRWREYYLDGVKNIKIGRSKTNDIQLDNINVSRNHATIESRDGNVYIIDNNSSNGIFINGERVRESTRLRERDVISIANSTLFYTKNIILYKKDIGGTRVLVQGIGRTVKKNHRTEKILSNINLQIEPNDFVAIIGGSGSGKTTVMNAISGFERATSGKVFVNSVDLYKNYKSLKSMIGYVPQQDIIYENITLLKMLEYSAMLRMPNDVTKSEIKSRIAEVLDMVELQGHENKIIRELSGGQRKRASIAVELLANPGLFFLDEPTSGLDPGTEESLMRNLRKLSKQSNKTIVMVTHTTQNLHLCDKIILMGQGGKICFYGSVPQCLDFFGVENIVEVYNMVSDEKGSNKWSDTYYRRFGIHQHLSNTKETKTPKTKQEPFFKMLSVLISRYVTLIKNDKQRLLMIALQPVLIGILLSFVASDTVFEIYNSTKSILFALSCAGIWIGLFNSIQEICKERVILKREYMANLRLDAYIASKFIVQLALSILQAILICLVFGLTVGYPQKGVMIGNAAIEMTITIAFTIFSSSGLGLIVSAISKNSDKAMTVAPFILIIQLLFSGILFELSDVTEKLSYLTISKWSVAALGISSDLNSLPSAGGIARSFEDIFEYSSGNLINTWIIMFIVTIVYAIISIVLLRNVSKDSR